VVTARPQLTDAEVEALLGAYALNACEPDEAAAVESVLARNPVLAREAELLARAAAWLGAAEALDPPSTLRGSVMDTIGNRDRGRRSQPVVDLYRAQSERFARAIDDVSQGNLDAATTNGLSARDLVVHEAAQESLLAQAVGASPLPEIAETDIDARTAAFVEHFQARALDDAIDVWQAAVDANCEWARTTTATAVNWRGLDLAADDAIVVRAFETWIHTDDLRRVVGLPGQPPAPHHLALMSDLAGRALSMSLALVGRAREGKTARLVLTGPGGGEWLVAMDGSGPGHGVADVSVTADTVDWCLLVGDRITPEALEHAVEGDAELAADLLAAAPALATL
jgi:uncharacterized protein (TIGR03083 family)